MELIIGCVYCGVNRIVSISEFCYTDLMADHLVLPTSPQDVARKHYWTEIKVFPDWYDKGEEGWDIYT